MPGRITGVLQPCHSEVTDQHELRMYESIILDMGATLLSGGVISISERARSGTQSEPLCKGGHVFDLLLRLQA